MDELWLPVCSYIPLPWLKPFDEASAENLTATSALSMKLFSTKKVKVLRKKKSAWQKSGGSCCTV